MEAIQLNNVARSYRYACGGITVTPNPPQVGVATTIAMSLKNPGPEPVTVSRIETMVSQFGMGVPWEQLPAAGPLHLPADHVEEVSMQWTPLKGGHRCVRANIHIETLPQPLRIGRNLQVIESEAERAAWRLPFRLGNPEDERMPIVLEVDGNNPEVVATHLVINSHMLQPGEPIWLNAREEVNAILFLRARTNAALENVSTVEAYIGGRFLDGIQVVVHRPARTVQHPRDLIPTLERTEPGAIMDEAAVLAQR